MRFILQSLFLGILTLALAGGTVAQADRMLDDTPPPAVLSAGTPLNIILQSPVDTAINQGQDPVEAALPRDVYLGETRILSKDARLTGQITLLETPIEGRDALLKIQFTALLLPDGRQIPLESHVQTHRPDHAFGGWLTPGTIPKKVRHHVNRIGSYNQIVYRGPRAMGQHIRFLPGERWTLILDQPLVLPTE